MFRFALAGALALALEACATAPPPAAPPERLSFAGTLDLSQPGIGFHLTHESGLACDARYSLGRLPETVTLPLSCNEEQSGTLTVAKATDIRGAVTLADGRMGDAIFVPPIAPRVAVVAPPPVAASAPPPVAAVSFVTPPRVVRTGPVYVRSHYRRGGHVRGHYRKGKWVSGHSRRGTTVRGHYRRR
jgi:hypothetical protein